MGYREIRLQRDIQLLKQAGKRNDESERQLRQGCVDLIKALLLILADLDKAGRPASPEALELIAKAETMFSSGSEPPA